MTREQLVTMLYRYAKYKKYDTTGSDLLEKYPDGDSVSAFAREAMSWAVAEQLVAGDQGLINPQGDTLRVTCAAIIQRFLESHN